MLRGHGLAGVSLMRNGKENGCISVLGREETNQEYNDVGHNDRERYRY